MKFEHIKYIVIPFFLLFINALLVVKITLALFSNSAASVNNNFQASTAFPSLTPSPTPTINPGDIVINEINWAGSNGDGNDEWIELRNTTSNVIDLSNWVIENLGTGSGSGANIAIPAGKSIPVNGFFIISALTQSGSRINTTPDVVNSSISLNNGGEQLILKTSSGVTIDTANGTFAWFFGANSTPKKSMERKDPPGNGTSSVNWQNASTHTNMDGSGATDEFATPKIQNGI